MTRRETLGFDRKLDLAWLDAAAAAAARGDSLSDARQQLYAVLEGIVKGDGPRSGRGKTITVLSRIWLNPGLDGFRGRAVAALEQADAGERLAIHWAMCSGTHPFFVDTAAAAGRLVRMQGDVAQAQVVRRVAETWGDRSTLHRAVQRTCRTFIDWGVLQETDIRGVYEAKARGISVGGNTARLLLEGMLRGGKSPAAPLAELVRHPALFPFSVNSSAGDLRVAPQFRLDRQGLDVDVVGLTTESA